MKDKYKLGLIGGMGTFASLAFMGCLYDAQKGHIKNEQDFINTALLNISDMPERGYALNTYNSGILLTRLQYAIDNLLYLNVSKFCILCYTMHLLVDELSPHHGSKFISLVDATLNGVINAKQKALLLATTTVQSLKLFHKSKLWPQASKYIIIPNDNHQNQIHKLIFDLKMTGQTTFISKYINQLLIYYGVNAWVTGCTELFLLINNNDMSVGKILHPIDITLNKVMKQDLSLMKSNGLCVV